MERPRVGIVIPALNEGRTIAAVVGQAVQFGKPVVVDDGSTDETARLAADAGADVVRLETNRGYDRALDAGFARAKLIDSVASTRKEDREIELFAFELRERLAGRTSGGHLVAFVAEQQAEGVEDVRLIVGDKHADHRRVCDQHCPRF